MKKIPDSELEIMMIIWDAGCEVSSDYIISKLDKSWARPTVLNFLSRLCDRGYLSCEKHGRQNCYRAIVDVEQYRRSALGDFMAKLFHNSPTSLIASLWDGGKISEEEREALRSFIDDNKG